MYCVQCAQSMILENTPSKSSYIMLILASKNPVVTFTSCNKAAAFKKKKTLSKFYSHIHI